MGPTKMKAKGTSSTLFFVIITHKLRWDTSKVFTGALCLNKIILLKLHTHNGFTWFLSMKTLLIIQSWFQWCHCWWISFVVAQYICTCQCREYSDVCHEFHVSNLVYIKVYHVDVCIDYAYIMLMVSMLSSMVMYTRP